MTSRSSNDDARLAGQLVGMAFFILILLLLAFGPFERRDVLAVVGMVFLAITGTIILAQALIQVLEEYNNGR